MTIEEYIINNLPDITDWEDYGNYYCATNNNIWFTLDKKDKSLSFKIMGYINGDSVLKQLQTVNITINDLIVKVTHKEMKDISNENIIPIEGIIQYKDTTHTIRLYWDKDLDIYYAYTAEFEYQGIPYCKLIDYSTYLKMQNNDGWELQPKSLLAMYGYNVSEVGFNERKEILQLVIDNHILSWRQIINHLEWCIYMHKTHDKAKEKWNKDIDFIRHYVKEKRLK